MDGHVRGPSAEELHEYVLQIRPQYARTPADALQCKLDAIAGAVTATNMRVPYAIPEWQNEENCVVDAHVLSTAPLYFWTARIADVVEQASRSYPLQEETFLPTLPRAFCVFERPVLWAVINDVRVGLSAVTWTRAVDPAGGPIRLRVRGVVWTPPQSHICFAADITNSLHIDNPENDPTLEDEVRTIYRWMCSASMFVEQRIAEHAAVRVGKHVAQRAARLQVAPTCSVVQMRRLDRRQRGDGADQETAVEWQCQWLVRGHWRQQFYPSANRHVPRWIAPYIKGPFDKPMRTPNPTVFVVKR
jgi:hypothetical protein